ncbi:RidA family protein [Sulfitobacter sp. F26169L]|uniref:RidA family protein n=1 Tax=Sulfitobacter sp. F26169L TaxID=2996015 RepID=UPI002260B2D9|nr:RidA family protein [Sulfitobacter sp. F26169L]MCX7568117.1 RidA family protein [Sulfitobacter sp. F26169L]
MTQASSKGAQPLAKYTAWQRRGDFIFMSGVIAVDPAAGKIITGYGDLPDHARAALGETGEFSSDYKEGPLKAQTWFVFDRIKAMIEDAGGEMGDVFKLVQYFKNLSDFPNFNRVRRLFFPDVAPVSTVVEVSGMMPSSDILIEVEATAYLPETT